MQLNPLDPVNGKIAFFLAELHGGGAERVAVNLIKGLAQRKLLLELVLAEAEGPYLSQVPSHVNLVNLSAGRVLKAIWPLTRYLKQHSPQVLISHEAHANVIAAIACLLAGVNTRLIVVEHDTLSATPAYNLKARLVPPLMRWVYYRADRIIGVSQAAATDLQTCLPHLSSRVRAIYNPVVDQELLTRSRQAVTHPWLINLEQPVYLGVGRLTPQKDFATLIRAFAEVRNNQSARLIVLGEGEQRPELEALVSELNLTQDVDLPGFTDNPYAYMRQASALVLSSRWEALPTVLIEAMACGCPVIATRCPSGPEEILAGGQYGPLVEPGDSQAMATAMMEVLNLQSQVDVVARAMQFSVEQSVDAYLQLMGAVCTA